jgi:DNA-binding MarR family transcriptional regulator
VTAASSQSASDLYPLWRRIGVNFTGESARDPVDIERLIIDTAEVASTDERLTVCAASWLAQFHDLVDGRSLSERTRAASRRTRAYLGAILTLVTEAPEGAGRAPQFETTLSHCTALSKAQPFYNSVTALREYRDWMRKNTLPLYRRWNLLHDDAGLQHKSIHSLEWLLKVPELRARALLSPSVEAACIAHTLNRVTNARQLSRELGTTYAAIHAAVDRLVGRGLLVKSKNGVRQELRLSSLCADIIQAA